MEVEPDRTPAFFKTMVDCSRALRIPHTFLNFLDGDFCKTATLVGPSRGTWTVEAKRSNGGIKLKEGWKKFCKDNSVGPADVLLFSYEGCMRFRVKFFEPSGVERKVQVQVPSPASSPSEKMENADKGNPSSGNVDLEVDQYLTDPKNPYFVTEVKNIKGNKLFIPAKVLRECGMELAPEITYSDPAGHEFKGKVGEWGDGRVYLTGWRSFVNCNKLEKGEKCIIELVMQWGAAAGKICNHMNVHILP